MNGYRFYVALGGLLLLTAGAGAALGAGKPKPPPSPPPTYPSARFWHNIAANGGITAATSRVYMHGGDDLSYLNDLWYFSAASGQWTFLAPSGRSWPELGRGNGALSCGDGKCVLFAGTTGTKYLNETWYFSEPTTGTSVSWTKVSCRTPNACPAPRLLPLMAFDPTRHYFVSFGGEGNSDAFNASTSDTWTFGGTAWTLRASSSSAPARSAGSAVFVPSHVSNGTSISVDKVVIFGGNPYPNAPYPAALCDLWAWNGSSWEAIVAPDPRPCLVGATMGWDTTVAANPRLVVAGGFLDAGGGPHTDTWYFTFTGANNGTWSKASTVVCAPLPFARGAYDVPSKKLVFFGGSDGQANAYDDTLVCP